MVYNWVAHLEGSGTDERDERYENRERKKKKGQFWCTRNGVSDYKVCVFPKEK